MKYARPLLVFLGISAFIGAFGLFERVVSFRELAKKAEDAFQNGQYAAALGYYQAARVFDLGDRTHIEERIDQSKQYLLAEKNLERAHVASEKGEWLEVKPLLKDVDPGFSQYNEVRALYDMAAEKVEALEKKIENDLTDLRSEAAHTREKLRAEQISNKQLNESLRETEQAKTTAEQQTAEAKRQKTLAEESAARERLQKFLNEFYFLAGALSEGSASLARARDFIEDGVQDGAISSVTRARAFFDTAVAQASEFRDQRTPAEYKIQSESLARAASLFIESARSFLSASAYTDAKESGTFVQFFTQGKEQFDSASKTLNELVAFLRDLRAANP